MNINYYQPDGTGKITITSAADGHLPDALCPDCGAPTMHAVRAMILRTNVAIAGAMPKAGGTPGIQLVCANTACAAPPSAIVTPDQPRSHP